MRSFCLGTLSETCWTDVVFDVSVRQQELVHFSKLQKCQIEHQHQKPYHNQICCLLQPWLHKLLSVKARKHARHPNTSEFTAERHFWKLMVRSSDEEGMQYVKTLVTLASPVSESTDPLCEPGKAVSITNYQQKLFLIKTRQSQHSNSHECALGCTPGFSLSIANRITIFLVVVYILENC